jgi:CRP/FNR family cyclic AMP-dependent transcriptional regulator
MVSKVPQVQLEQFPFFAGIPQQQLEVLAQSATIRSRPPKAGVYYPGDTADSVFFLIAGRIKLGIVSEDGREVIKRVVTSGEMFGESALLGETIRSEFAIPMKLDASAVSIRSADLFHAIKSNPELTNRFIQHLGERVRISESLMEAYVLKDSKERIIDFILDIDANSRDADSKAYHFMTHQDIAGITGASRQFVTSVMNDLRKRKLIDFNRISIVVKDRKGLQMAI